MSRPTVQIKLNTFFVNFAFDQKLQIQFQSLQNIVNKSLIRSIELSMNPEVPIRKRKYLYTIEQKRSILKEQERNKSSNTCIAQKYNVNESAIRKWKKAIDIDVQESKDSKRKTIHAGKESKGIHLEGDICQWIDNALDSELDLTAEQVAFEILKLDPDFCGGDLKRTRKWVYPFLVRNGYSIQQTMISTNKISNN
jgi:transposase-like protein